jgi:hypothetical protein
VDAWQVYGLQGTGSIDVILDDVLLALIGYTLNWLFLKVEKRVLGWHRGARGRTATS